MIAASMIAAPMIAAPKIAAARAPAPVRRAPSSSIRTATARGDRAVNLALGEPTWPLPQAASRALATVDRCGYGPHAGESALRREISVYEGASPDELLVTAGAQAALFVVTQTYLGPGDVALIPDPGFPAYLSLSELAGARAAPYPLALGTHDLDADALLARLEQAPDAKFVFLNHPANPTGGLASAGALRRVAEACEERGVLLVSDEVYRELHAPASSTPASLRDVSRTGLVVGSVSKAWAAPGLRVGWLVGDPDILEPCRAFHALMTTHAATSSQAAALALLEARAEILDESRRQLDVRREALREAWLEATGREPKLPKHGLYSWFWVGDDVEFCRKAGKEGVALVPGSAFGNRGRGFVRLSLGAPPEAIGDGVRRLRRLLS